MTALKALPLIAAAIILATVATIRPDAVVAQGESTVQAPGNVIAANGENPGDVLISWKAVEDAAHYRVGWVAYPDYEEIHLNGGRPWDEAFAFVDVENIGQTTRTVRRLTPGTLYAFRVGSNDNRYGQPKWSQWVMLTLNDGGISLPKPQNYTLVPGHDEDGNSVIKASWDKISDDVEHYVCWREASASDWESCGWDGEPTYESTHRRLTPGVSHDFAIRAVSSRIVPRHADPVFSEWVFATATVPEPVNRCPTDEICDDLSNTRRANLWLRLWMDGSNVEVSAKPAFDVSAYGLNVVVRSGNRSEKYCNTSTLHNEDEAYTQLGCGLLKVPLSAVGLISAEADGYGLRCARQFESTVQELIYACVWRN